MPAPRSLRLTLAPITTSAITTAAFQPSLLHKHVTSTSPLTPRLKSPAFHLSHTTTDIANSNHHQNSNPRSPSPSTPTPSLSFPARPPSPLAWTWRCHLCHTNYRIGTTRRCLIDGHYFCSQPPPSPVSPPSPEKLVPPPRLAERKEFRESPDGGDGAKKAMTRKTGIKNGKARRKTGKPAATCTTSFDYLAWADWNAWRREVSGSRTIYLPAAASRIPGLVVANKGEGVKTRKDCFTDCDFPSECRWRCSGAYLEAVREELEEEEGEGLI